MPEVSSPSADDNKPVVFAPESELPPEEAAERNRALAEMWIAEQAIGAKPTQARVPLGARTVALLGRHHGALALLCVLLLWVVMALRPPDQGQSYQKGAVALDDIVAPRAARVLDRRLTEQRKRQAAAGVFPVYDNESQVPAQALAELRRIAQARRQTLQRLGVAALPASPTETQATTKGNSAANKLDAPSSNTGGMQRASQAATAFNEHLERTLPQELALRVLRMSPHDWLWTEKATQEAIRAAYADGEEAREIRSDHLADDLAAARRRMSETARFSVQKNSESSVARASHLELAALPGRIEATSDLANALARHVVYRPNFIYNERKTAQARREARDKTPAAYIDIQPDTILVGAGSRIDDAAWAQLQDLDMVAAHFSPSEAAAQFLLCVLVVAFCAAALARFQPTILRQPVALWLAAMLPIAFLALLRWVLRIPQGDAVLIALLAMATMMLTLLFGLRVGMLGTFFLTAMGGLMVRADSGQFVAILVTSAVAALAVSNLTAQLHIVRAACVLGGAHAALMVALSSLPGASPVNLWNLVGWSFGTGAVAVPAALCAVALLEKPFGLSTHLGLIELVGGSPLVQRLQLEASGTHSHSLAVAQMSETAAKAIGADALLCRVAGLHHDIGKMRRPLCFIENQGSLNVHKYLTPQMSASLIVAHVADGCELARAKGLPQPIYDIIAQHHGTTRVEYFYRLALAHDENVDESLFRYAGPKPQTKEAAIVLLADTVEASTRSMKPRNEEELQTQIRAMFAARLQEGELSDCDLTLRELEEVKSAFAQVLGAMQHQRIAYPGQPEYSETPKNPAREWRWPSRILSAERRRKAVAHDETVNALNAHLQRHGKNGSGTKTASENGAAANGAAANAHGAAANGAAHTAQDFHDTIETSAKTETEKTRRRVG